MRALSALLLFVLASPRCTDSCIMGRVILLQAEQSKGFLDGSRSSLRFQEVTCITELSGSIEV